MTLPAERYNAINHARELLRALLDPKRTPRVPMKIRREARYCLKHYISEHELDTMIRKGAKGIMEIR